MGRVVDRRDVDQCRWVKPNLVCQVAFVDSTNAGHPRHCAFIGMRDDKMPAGVVRETGGHQLGTGQVHQPKCLSSKA